MTSSPHPSRDLPRMWTNSAGRAPARCGMWTPAPILERDFAQRAGLGFVGKHTGLISRTLGNWLLLAEILTTAEFAPDPPQRNHCGSCTRCLDACPTGALPAPFTLDARRCISYLTIEHKGSIPLELRPLIGHRVFGCDDCLAACPWNRFRPRGDAHAGRAPPGPGQART
jgi:epoxyqueuosine reductase